MNFRQLQTATYKALACTALIGCLSACGGDDTDPLQKYYDQALRWTTCDSTILGASADRELWTEVADRLSCSAIRAPLDWANADRGEVVLTMMRLAAGEPTKRRGALLFNPGGPGGDGLPQTFNLYGAFHKSNPENPQGARQLRLLAEYDMVGFSPRGTGSSTQLKCGSNEIERVINTSTAEWDTAENIANSQYNARIVAEACLRNPIAPYINTHATARDMELMRRLLGEEKLNYVGYSYGTWLGAWYASTFPENVGRMVLDSSIDFSNTLEKWGIHGQPAAQQRLLDEVLAPYAARHADYFKLGPTASSVREALPNLSPKVQQATMALIKTLITSPVNADTVLSAVSAALTLDAVLNTQDQPYDVNAVNRAIDQAVFDPLDPERGAELKSIAKALWSKYETLWIHRDLTSLSLTAKSSVNLTVRCNDTEATTDLSVWNTLLRGLAERAPLFFSSAMEYPCLFWGGPTVIKPDLGPMKPLDVLFVQSQYDASTPSEGANNFFSQVSGARRVFVSNDFQHGVYPYADSCVDPIVTDYLLGENQSQREIVCQGHPLAQDAKAFGLQPKAVNSPPVYIDQKKAAELIHKFKEGIGPRSSLY